ncbi:MAG: transposase [Bacteroidia bacterium]
MYKEENTLLLPETVYHIYNHANGWENLFSNEGNYLFFLKRYQYFIEPIAETLAYCLMPNHLHLMIRIRSKEALQAANTYFCLAKEIPMEEIEAIPETGYSVFLSRVFANLFSSYSQAYNKQQKRRGSLFMPNFKRKVVDNTAYYVNLIHYIHNNPVHHGFTKEAKDWQYSSYLSFLSDKQTKLMRDEVLDWFGGKANFEAFHESQEIGDSFNFEF